MVRRADRPLRSVRVSFETSRLSAQHLIDAYAQLVPVRRARLRSAPAKIRLRQASPARKRGGEP